MTFCLVASLLLAAAPVEQGSGSDETATPGQKPEQHRSEKTIYLVPLGDVETKLLEVARDALTARINAEVLIAPRRDLPEEAWYAPRKRYRAEKLITALNADPPAGAWRIVGVTEQPISTTKGRIFDWGIAGLGDLDGRSCVLSSAIYKKNSRDRASLERRFADLVVHEFGHTLGLNHCEVQGCVMADAKGKAIRSADTSTSQYCAKCRGLVEARLPAILKPEP